MNAPTKIVQKLFCSFPRRLYSSNSSIELKTLSTGVTNLILNHKPVNSLNIEFLTNISDTLKNIEKDDSVRGLVISSKFHGKVFSAGLHIPDLYNRSDLQLGEFWRGVQEWHLDLCGLSKPVVSAINGHSPAGGCAMALMSDYRVMMKGRTIGLNETMLGLVAPVFFVGMYASVLGRHRAELALALGTLFTSDEAWKCGLINDLCDLDDVMTVAHQQAEKLSAVPRTAFAANKRIFREEALQALRDNREHDIQNFVGLVQRPETQKAIERYLEQLKRK